MQLIGMLDSPYVRRVAIALRLLDLPFEHRPLSVFDGFDDIRRINPAVKVPTLVCEDGGTLMDSGLIIDHIETLAGRSLWPAAGPDRLRALRLTGLALAACEKIMQLVYERGLRPPEKQHEPWVTRLETQLSGAHAALDAELAARPLPLDEGRLDHAAVAVAIAWRFTTLRLGEFGGAGAFPALAAFSAQAEQLPAFAEVPPDERFTVAPRHRASA